MKSFVALMLACGAVAAAAQQPPEPDLAGWREDLRVLAREVPARHANAFAKITRAQWDSAVASLDARLPDLTRNQLLVELFRLVAFLGDAHSTVQPGPALGFRYYPLELYRFDDGLYIRRAVPALAELVGARVLRIGRASADSALAVVGSTLSHENDWWVRAWGPFRLMMPEFLDGLGLVADAERLPLVVERDGRVDTVTVTPAGRLGPGHGPVPIDMSGWTEMRRAEPPLWEQRPDRPFWWRWLPESGTLYVAYRAVVPQPRSNTNRGFWDEVFAVADTAPVRHLVLDIRDNTGGNGFLNRYPIQQILRRPALDRRDVLFVIIGRRTFSAGQQLANLLEFWTQATLVGEPTGQQPSQYGDHRDLILPNSQVVVGLSTVFHQAPNVFDARAFVPPGIYTPLTAADYRQGVDPAMRAILAEGTTPSVTEAIERAIAAGDTALAERALRDGRGAVANRFRSFESEVNGLGYRLLGEGQVERAVAVFALNTRVYPHSANTFDSLGEALLAAGRRDAAIAAYRRALAIEPGFPPSVQALQRLGVR